MPPTKEDKDSLSLCPHCYCMTKTIPSLTDCSNRCGKCGKKSKRDG